MRERSDPETDSTAGVSNVPWVVEAVRALPDYRLHVRFIDGTEGRLMHRAFCCLTVPASLHHSVIQPGLRQCMFGTE